MQNVATVTSDFHHGGAAVDWIAEPADEPGVFEAAGELSHARLTDVLARDEVADAQRPFAVERVKNGERGGTLRPGCDGP